MQNQLSSLLIFLENDTDLALNQKSEHSLHLGLELYFVENE